MILENFKLKGIRTSCLDGKEKEVELGVEYFPPQSKEGYATHGDNPSVYLVGGPTGYESFSYTPEVIERMEESGWCACAGTTGRWDKLRILSSEMRRLFTALKGVI